MSPVTERYAASTSAWAAECVGESRGGRLLLPNRSDERARGRIQVHEEVASLDAGRDEMAIAERGDVEPFGFLIGSLNEEAVLPGADEEIGRYLDRPALEEHLEPAFLAPAYTVEDRDQRADDARRVLDRADRRVLDVVAEDIARARENPRGRSEEPGEYVGAVDRMLQERAAARVVTLRTPRAVAGNDVARRPVLVVAQGVTHGRAELVGGDEPDELVDQRMKPRVEADLGGKARRPDERAHLAHDVESGCERLLAEQRFAGRDNRVNEITMGRRRRDDHDRFDVGIVDDGLRVGRDPFERTDRARGLHGIGGEVGHRDRTHLTIVGEKPQRVRVTLPDHPCPDQAHANSHVYSLGLLTAACGWDSRAHRAAETVKYTNVGPRRRPPTMSAA